MSASKGALKSIKVAISREDFESARKEATDLVKQEPSNYAALVFLGFALEKLNDPDGAEKAYCEGTVLKPADPQALKGLIVLYEKHGSKYLDRYHKTAVQLAQIYLAEDDQFQCQSVIDKYQTFARKHGSGAQYRTALELILPTSGFYTFLEGRLPHTAHTLSRIIDSTEIEEKEWTNTQVGERRTRLGAKVDQVILDVKREALAKYPLEALYQKLIDWTQDDELRRQFEEKLLERAYATLLVLPPTEKPAKRAQVFELAKGMVIIRHAFELAWSITLEWVDAILLADWDVSFMREFIVLFPDTGLAQVLRSWLASSSSPFEHVDDENHLSSAEEGEQIALSEADQLVMMFEGLQRCNESPLANRILADAYLSLEETRSAIETARKAQSLYINTAQTCGIDLQRSLDAIGITLANALVIYQSPRNHPEALQLFEKILERRPGNVAVLSGVGKIMEEGEDFDQAVSFLDRALRSDVDNVKIKAELAWCRALCSEFLETGLNELEDVLRLVIERQPDNFQLKSVILYRIGYCQWQLNDESHPRARKDGPYRYFMDAVKVNPSYAPAYTMLGVFFADYAKSRRRARTAFQKAFELSSAEIEAAYRLACIFADDDEWDLVELVANRVVDSGKAIPAPGSKKKAHSWPFAALGIVNINKQSFSGSIIYLRKALRIAPYDYQSWVSLGESYYHSGRHVAAERALRQAQSMQKDVPSEQVWFAKYMLATVQRATKSYGESIAGYREVLKLRPDDQGVGLALMHTYTESGWTSLEAGRLYEAYMQASTSLLVAGDPALAHADTFSLWQAIGDACAIIASVTGHCQEMDLAVVRSLLEARLMPSELDGLYKLDGLGLTSLHSAFESDATQGEASKVETFLVSGVLSSKKAILAAAHDVHAQAVSWYNLGWSEHRLASSKGSGTAEWQRQRRRCCRAATKCFKKAIELEAGNPEFWNSFGVSTLQSHPALCQHALVRSLYLNDKSARVWTNLGAFYILHNDYQLANEAFTRAQSADPEYALAWLGQGMLAMLAGDSGEANGLFTHAFELAGSSSVLLKQQYARSRFDSVVTSTDPNCNVADMIEPLFALRQVALQSPQDLDSKHLMALFAERLGEFEETEAKLQQLCTAMEEEYEDTESNEALSRYLQSKSDLGRAQLGRSDYQQAIESANLVLDLAPQDDSSGMEADLVRRWRLSAHLTAAVAHHFLGEIDPAISLFQLALDESDSDPDIVCMLANMMLTKNNEETTPIHDQIADAIDRYPEHVRAVTMLVVIALQKNDPDELEAAEVALRALRSHDKVSTSERERVSKSLMTVALKHMSGETAADTAISRKAIREIMVTPAQHHGWTQLAEAAHSGYAAEMALVNARQNVPPRGDINAEALGLAFSRTGRRTEALQGVMLAPWKADGWQALAQSLQTL